jgi:hypothetical protein
MLDSILRAELQIPPLWDQGAPPAAARCAGRPGNVNRIHRGTAGYRSAHADRPARRRPRAGDGSATTGGTVRYPSQPHQPRIGAPSASIIEHLAVGINGAPRRCAMVASAHH